MRRLHGWQLLYRRRERTTAVSCRLVLEHGGHHERQQLLVMPCRLRVLDRLDDAYAMHDGHVHGHDWTGCMLQLCSRDVSTPHWSDGVPGLLQLRRGLLDGSAMHPSNGCHLYWLLQLELRIWPVPTGHVQWHRQWLHVQQLPGLQLLPW